MYKFSYRDLQQVYNYVTDDESTYLQFVDEHPLKKGEFYLNVCETNYRRMEPPLPVAVSGLMGVGQFIHRVVEILGNLYFNLII